MRKRSVMKIAMLVAISALGATLVSGLQVHGDIQVIQINELYGYYLKILDPENATHVYDKRIDITFEVGVANKSILSKVAVVTKSLSGEVVNRKNLTSEGDYDQVSQDEDGMWHYRYRYLYSPGDGDYVVTISAYLTTGDTATKSVSVTVDTISPVVNFITPSDKEVLSQNRVAVKWAVTDNTGIKECDLAVVGNDAMDGGVKSEMAGPEPRPIWINETERVFLPEHMGMFIVNPNVTEVLLDLPNDVYIIAIRVMDYAGNEATKNINVRVNAQPQVLNLTASRNDDEIDLSFLTDALPINVKYELYRDGKLVDSKTVELRGTPTNLEDLMTVSSYYKLSENLPEGNYTLRANFTNSAGNYTDMDVISFSVNGGTGGGFLEIPSVSYSDIEDFAKTHVLSVTVAVIGALALIFGRKDFGLVFFGAAVVIGLLETYLWHLPL